MELTKGDHIFFSSGLTGSEHIDFELAKIEEEEDRNKAVLLLKNADDVRFGTIAANSRKVSSWRETSIQLLFHPCLS